MKLRSWMMLIALLVAAPMAFAETPSQPKEAEKPAEAAEPDPDDESADYETLMGRSLGPNAIEKSNIKYVEGDDAHARHVLDLYLPKDKKDFPVVFFVHGGSWYEGEKRHGKAIARGLLAHGYGIVSVNYRLVADPFSPPNGVAFPLFVEDAAAALAWTVKQIAQHGGDPKQIYLMGHSAGGHIASLIATDPSWLEKHELKRNEVVRGFVGISGAYDVPQVNDPDAQRRSMALMMSYAFPQDAETRKRANTLNQVCHDAPPTLLLYAEQEFFGLDRATVGLDRKLAEFGVARQVRKISARNHITILGSFGTRGDKASEHAVAFLKALREGKLESDPVPEGVEVRKRPGAEESKESDKAAEAEEKAKEEPEKPGEEKREEEGEEAPDDQEPEAARKPSHAPVGDGRRTPADDRANRRKIDGVPNSNPSADAPRRAVGAMEGRKQERPNAPVNRARSTPVR